MKIQVSIRTGEIENPEEVKELQQLGFKLRKTYYEGTKEFTGAYRLVESHKVYMNIKNLNELVLFIKQIENMEYLRDNHIVISLNKNKELALHLLQECGGLGR